MDAVRDCLHLQSKHGKLWLHILVEYKLIHFGKPKDGSQ